MAKYRARICPQCEYYLGFTVAKSRHQTQQVAVSSFCLNCNYKLPVHSVISGIRRAISPFRRGALRLASALPRDPASALDSRNLVENMGKLINPSDYSRHLRAIGQDLEKLRLTSFNLECTGAAYLVWTRSDSATAEGSPLFRLGRNRLQKLWRNKTQTRIHGQEEYFSPSPSPAAKRLRYSLPDLDRMEREQRNRRLQRSGVTDGHALSQLLRTVGELVGQKSERLLGIAWQELSVSMVVETAQGRREIDVFRPDNLYDRWVGMYLKRDSRALSDIPH
jgi:hypothetical protein